MAPKKGKGKPKETDEERAVRLEAEAHAAAEAARKQEEAARLRLRESQLREEKYAHINGIKIHNQWRKIMRTAKVEDMLQDVEILSQTHERTVDRKDAIIQMLDRDLEDADEQYSMALCGHLQVVDSLLDLQYARMKALQQHFSANLKALEDEFEAERQEIVGAHHRLRKDLGDLSAAMRGEHGEAENEARQEFEAAREEIKNRNSEEYNVLKISLEGQCEELERAFEAAHQAYLQNTEVRTQAFRQLTKSDASAARIIEKRMRKLVKLQESLAHWRAEIASNWREWEERNRALRAEKDIMARNYQALKAAMDNFRRGQNRRLKQLSIDSTNTEKELTKQLRTAESILKLAELCRKLETEDEKVVPFGLSTDAEADSANPESPGAESTSGAEQEDSTGLHAYDMNGRPIPENEYFSNFFKRYNKVLLDATAVDNEKRRLEQENADLRRLLKQFLDGISVNDDVLNNPVNPLLVVNNRLQLKLKAVAQEQAKGLRPGSKQQLGLRQGKQGMQLSLEGESMIKAFHPAPAAPQTVPVYVGAR